MFGAPTSRPELSDFVRKDWVIFPAQKVAQGFVNALGMLENGGRPQMTPQTRSR
jgi:hypothetical protein